MQSLRSYVADGRNKSDGCAGRPAAEAAALRTIDRRRVFIVERKGAVTGPRGTLGCLLHSRLGFIHMRKVNIRPSLVLIVIPWFFKVIMKKITKDFMARGEFK